ncbi:MAG TPA: cell division protein FtsZ [Chondromyces sp.]|nr:cell division protein FtsZ [Chondromyces sp.]
MIEFDDGFVSERDHGGDGETRELKLVEPGPAILLDETPAPARIKVIGVGGGGCNSVNRMIEAGLGGVEFIAANTDAQALSNCRAPIKLQLGMELTRGLGAGANPEVGRNAALEADKKIFDLLDGADMIFITCGMGGGTGTGAAPIIAQMAQDVGALTVAVVTKPFSFEGSRRRNVAEEGIAQLGEHVDTLITIPNDRLLKFVERNTNFTDAMSIADDVLRQAVQGIADIITVPGLINRDFADVRTVMKGMGHAIMGVGTATGEHRAVEAAQQAIASPLLEETSIEGARGLLINISGGDDVTLNEINEAAEIITEGAHPDAQILFGAVVDPELGDGIQVTVIATGFHAEPDGVQLPAAKVGPRVERSFDEAPATRSSRFLVPGGPNSEYGINQSDDYEIPAILRKQMD